jgi:hypothetical protein
LLIADFEMSWPMWQYRGFSEPDAIRLTRPELQHTINLNTIFNPKFVQTYIIQLSMEVSNADTHHGTARICFFRSSD